MHTGLSDIAAGDRTTAAARALITTFSSTTELAIRKLWQTADATELASENVIHWLAELWETLPRESMSSSRLEGLAASILMRCDLDRSRALGDQIAHTLTGALFMACVVHAVDGARYGPRDQMERREKVMPVLRDALVPRYRDYLFGAAAGAGSPLEITGTVRMLVLYWRLHFPDDLKSALQELMEERWDMVETIAWLLPLTENRDGATILSGFGDYSYITTVFDIDSVAIQLHGRLQGARDLKYLTAVPATREVRMEAALALVALALEQISSGD